MPAKTAYVTGGASGIGRAVVEMLAGRGYRVAIADRNFEGAKSVSKYLNFSDQEAFPVEVDVADWGSQVKAFETVVKEFGRVDYVYAIAGVGERMFFPNQPETEGFVKPDLTCIDIDLSALMWTVSLGIQQMRRQTPDDKGFRGKIAVTASVCGFYCVPSKHWSGMFPCKRTATDLILALPVYTAAKHGVVGFVRSYGKYLPEEKITLNAVCPNVVRTGISTSQFYDSMEEAKLLTPMKSVVDAFEHFVDNDISGECMEMGPNAGFTRRAPAEHLDKESGLVMEKLYGRALPLHQPKASPKAAGGPQN